MLDDATLLRRYADEKSEEAFAELVGRHIDLVYSAAVRQVGGDAHFARDVAQAVFARLAEKAGDVAGRGVLAGWLYTTTHYEASHLVRAERRRRVREGASLLMNECSKPESRDAEWAEMRPVLDEAMGGLKTVERDAVLMRFFEGRGFAEIAGRLELSENAARMRVERALDKLRGLLERRGIKSTSAALATVLASQAVQAAPLSVAASVAAGALAQAAGGATAVSIFSFMGVTKIQVGLAGALVLATGAAVVMQERVQAGLRAEVAVLERRDAERTIAAGVLRDENRELARAAAEVEAMRREREELPGLRERIAEAVQKAKQRAAQAWGGAVAGGGAAGAEAGGAREQEPVQDRRAVPVKTVPPVYPGAFMAAGIRGETVVSFEVDENGVAQDIKVERSTTAEFEASVIASVKRWTFKPATKDGRVVKSRLTVPFVFELSDPVEEWF